MDKSDGLMYADETYKLIGLCTASALTTAHEAQLMNYLKASKMKLGLLCNFAEPSFVYRRFVN